MSNDDTVHDAYIITWDVLERSGELRDLERSAKLIRYVLMSMVVKGEKRRIMLVHRAISAYRAGQQQLQMVS